jgi:ABC-type glutathione transport system ATPase component
MQPLLNTENLVKHYAAGRSRGSQHTFVALAGVSLSIASQTTVAPLGASRSGKGTLALCIACLEHPTSGRIWSEGIDVPAREEAQLRLLRPQIQLVFQDPGSSRNPRWTALELISEPLLVQRRFSRQERECKARDLLDRLAIPCKMSGRGADERSGGQKQRMAIARALQPKLIVLDEALSALDCSVQAQISNLLLELQTSRGLTYLLITHDFLMAAHPADQIAVMERGGIVESRRTEGILRAPSHEAARSLLAATSRFPETPSVLVNG